MNLKCIACEALARLVYLSAAYSPHVVDVELFKIGLHRDPDDLRAQLQARIDAVSGEGYDAIVMAYGLCGKATHGLTARDVPIVIPRAHDCITLFLGSRARYKDESISNPGTYWYVTDYIQRGQASGTSLSLGADVDSGMDGTYEDYVKKYGKDNADYLMEVMGAWCEHYNRAAYIDMGVGDSSELEAETQAEADRRGWTFERMTGDLVLIRHLLDGDWTTDDFLTLEPGQRIEMSYGDDVVRGVASVEA